MSAKESKKSQNTRQFPRIAFDTTPWTFSLLRAAPLPPDTVLRTEAKNISLGGLKFQSNTKVPLFSSVEIRLYPRDGKGETLHLPSKIVRLEETDTGHGEKTFGIAVQFISVDRQVEQSLAEILPATMPPTENIPAKK